MASPRVRTDHTHLTDQLRDDDGSSFDGSTPTLAEVLAEGNSTGEQTIVVAANDTITGTEGVLDLGGSGGAQLTASGFVALLGDSVQLNGTNGVDGGNGGDITLTAGNGDGAGAGGDLDLTSGESGDGGTGGAISLQGSLGPGGFVALSGGTGGEGDVAGGDIFISPGSGSGAGRGGLVILNSLPTVNPNVAGALWSDSGTLKVSAG